MSGTTRRTALGLGAALLAAPALGQSLWPTGPIRFIVTFPAGGSTDLRVGRAEVGDSGGACLRLAEPVHLHHPGHDGAARGLPE